jgi:large subunit ribosomal protein L29
MRVSDLRALSDADVQKRLADSQQELFNLRVQLATRQLENVRRVREVRKDIARLRLIAGERERVAAQ